MNRNALSSWARLGRRAVEPARSAGTVMLLVVGVLLLVLIVGMTYMHVVQEDRRAGLTVDIDAIVLAQADLVAIKLAEDLAIGSTGQHFADIHTNGTTNGTPDGKPDQEPYDYPGDEDKWLAATAPEGAGTGWTQVSMLGDAFWNGSALSDTVRTMTAGDASSASKAVNVGNAYADADGDGILDSKPEQAAVYSRGGLVFFAWTRVQDSSSLANVDVWHSQVSNAGAYNASANAPRWWYPGELDLGGLTFSLSSVHANYGAAMTDLANVLNQRGVGSALPTPWGIAGSTQRGHSFFFGSKRYENPLAPHKSLALDTSNAFDPTNELELRHRNGLVYLDTEAPIESTGWFRTILRGNVTSAESKYNDGVPGVSSIASYFTNEPRHQFTTYSGASIYRIPISGDTSTPFWGKRDINAILAGGATAAAAELATEISRVYSAGSPSLPSGVTTVTQLADQYAVNIVDYVDTDNQVTLRNGRYGMEALPAITEVYVQHPYEVVLPPTSGSAGNWNVTWETPVDHVTGYAIEIRNPFPFQISLENVHLYVGGALWGELSTLAGATTLAANDHVTLYRNSVGGSADNDVSALISGAAANKAAITNTWPTGTYATLSTVSLRAEDQDGNILAWDYCQAHNRQVEPTFANPNSDHPGPNAADVVGHTVFLRENFMGNGNKINALLFDKSQFTETFSGLASSVFNFGSITERLGDADKTGGGGPANQVGPTTTQIVFNNSGVMNHIGELMHIPIFGLTPSQTFDQSWGAATTAETFMPDPASTALVSSSEDYAVPHVVLLMDRLTALSPREDLVDNDGDSVIDNAEELFIPGTLNVNTAPEFLMDRVLPIGSSSIRQAYVDAIVAYRDAVASARPATHRPGRKGVAHMGELYNLSSLANASNYGANGASDYNGASFGSIQGDFLANPPAADDTIVDDREEKTLVTRWLSQTCSTRSDVYCAYILVRGYSPGNLTTPVTERRAAVLLDRSRIAAQDDGARVLGVIWY